MSAQEKAPAFQFYVKDYTTDEAVMMMSLEQEGAFIRLLCHAWLHGSIPSAVPQLAVICRVPAAKMARLWTGVACCFQEDGETGRLTNSRLEKSRAISHEYAEKQRAKGIESARRRFNRGSTAVEPEGQPDLGARLPSGSTLPRFNSPSPSPSPVRKTKYKDSDERKAVDTPENRDELAVVSEAVGFELPPNTSNLQAMDRSRAAGYTRERRLACVLAIRDRATNRATFCREKNMDPAYWFRPGPDGAIDVIESELAARNGRRAEQQPGALFVDKTQAEILAETRALQARENEKHAREVGQ